ncbi:N-methyl-L-tryptophan oxidase [Gottfriedia sp. NPDC056225]|uniref:N-methyl-L-tryptophan oxidase n=1 Tax=Gottfriedia sp. NPDC056225 TaxID=3345751 RepID=UPI0035DF4B95
MNKHYEVIIVGAGSMGMAAGYYLSKRNQNTLLIDAFDPPHSFGSHHGDTRIIRHAYGESREYVPLALRAQKLWEELEQISGRKLFSKTGVLCAGAPGSTFTQEVKKSAEEFSLPLEILDGSEINARWPGMNLPEGFIGCLETSSGILFSEDCIRAYKELYIQEGNSLKTNTPVMDIEIDSNIAIVRTEDAIYTADKLVVCAGAWSGKILEKTGVHIPLKPIRKTVGWFECDKMLYDSNSLPAFTIDLIDEHYYGFPNLHNSGLKIGRHDGGHSVDPNKFNREFGEYKEDEADLRSFLSQYIPKANGKLLKGKTCLYTMTPDEHFIIDQHPENKNIIIATGFSGHGFKFASGVGEIIADLVTKQKSAFDLSMFSLNRF